jgi:hypothetical protein
MQRNLGLPILRVNQDEKVIKKKEEEEENNRRKHAPRANENTVNRSENAYLITEQCCSSKESSN